MSGYWDPGTVGTPGGWEGDGEGEGDEAPPTASHAQLLPPTDFSCHLTLRKRAPAPTPAAEPGDPTAPPKAALSLQGSLAAPLTLSLSGAQLGSMARLLDAMDVWAHRNVHGRHRPASWRCCTSGGCDVGAFRALPRPPQHAAAHATTHPPGWAADGWRYAVAAVCAQLRASRRWTSRRELLHRRDKRVAYLAAAMARVEAPAASSSAPGEEGGSAGVMMRRSASSGAPLSRPACSATLSAAQSQAQLHSAAAEAEEAMEAIEAGLSVCDILLFRTLAERHAATHAACAQHPPPPLGAESSFGSAHSGGEAEGDAEASTTAAPAAQQPPQPSRKPGGGPKSGWLRSGVAYVLGRLPLVDARRRFPSLLAPEEKEWRDEFLRAMEATADLSAAGGPASAPLSAAASTLHVEVRVPGLSLLLRDDGAGEHPPKTLAQASLLGMAVSAQAGGQALREARVGCAVRLSAASTRVTLGSATTGAACSLLACAGGEGAASPASQVLALEVDIMQRGDGAGGGGGGGGGGVHADATLRGTLAGLTLLVSPLHAAAAELAHAHLHAWLPAQGSSLGAMRFAAAGGLGSSEARTRARGAVAASHSGPRIHIAAFGVEGTRLLLGATVAAAAPDGSPAAEKAADLPDDHHALSAGGGSPESPRTPPRDAPHPPSEPLSPPDQAAEQPQSPPSTPPPPPPPPQASLPYCISLTLRSLQLRSADERGGEEDEGLSVGAFEDVALSGEALRRAAARVCYTRLEVSLWELEAGLVRQQVGEETQAAPPQPPQPPLRLLDVATAGASLALLRLPADGECVSLRACVRCGCVRGRLSPPACALLRAVALASAPAPHRGDRHAASPHAPLLADLSLSVASVSCELLPASAQGYWQSLRLDGLALALQRTRDGGAAATASLARCRAEGAACGGGAPAVQLARHLPTPVPHPRPRRAAALHACAPAAAAGGAAGGEGARHCASCHVEGLDAALSWGALAATLQLARACAAADPSQQQQQAGSGWADGLAAEARACCERHSPQVHAHSHAHALAARHPGCSSAAAGGGIDGDSSSGSDDESVSASGGGGGDDGAATESEVWEDAASAWGTESEHIEWDGGGAASEHGGPGAHRGASRGAARAAAAQAAAAAAAAAREEAARHSGWRAQGLTEAARLPAAHVHHPDADPTAHWHLSSSQQQQQPPQQALLRLVASAASLRVRLLGEDAVTGGSTLLSVRLPSASAAAIFVGAYEQRMQRLGFQLSVECSGLTVADETGWRPAPVLCGRDAARPLAIALRASRDHAQRQLSAAVGVSSVRCVAAPHTLRALLAWATHGQLLLEAAAAAGPSRQQQPSDDADAAPDAPLVELALRLECRLCDTLLVAPEDHRGGPSGVEPRCALLELTSLTAHVTRSGGGGGGGGALVAQLAVQGARLTAAPSERSPGEPLLGPLHFTADAEMRDGCDASDASQPLLSVRVTVPRLAVALSPRRVALMAALARTAARLRAPGSSPSGASSASSPAAPGAPPQRGSLSLSVRVHEATLRLRGRGPLACAPAARLQLRGFEASGTARAAQPATLHALALVSSVALLDDSPIPLAARAPLFAIGGAASSHEESADEDETQPSASATAAAAPRVALTWTAAAESGGAHALDVRASLCGGALSAEARSWGRLAAAVAACADASHADVTPAAVPRTRSLADADSRDVTPASTPTRPTLQQQQMFAGQPQHHQPPHSPGMSLMSPMRCALETVAHAMPSVAAGGGYGGSSRAAVAVPTGLLPSASGTPSLAAAAAAAAVAVQPQAQSQSRAAMRVRAEVDAPGWEVQLPLSNCCQGDAPGGALGLRLRCGLTLTVSGSSAGGGDAPGPAAAAACMSVEARFAPSLLLLLEHAAARPQSSASAAGGASPARPHTPGTPRGCSAAAAAASDGGVGGHWSFPPRYERSLSFASQHSSTADLLAAPGSAAAAGAEAQPGAAAAAAAPSCAELVPIAQLDGLELRASRGAGAGFAAPDELSVRLGVAAVSAWASHARLRLLLRAATALRHSAQGPHSAPHETQTDGAAPASELLLTAPAGAVCAVDAATAMAPGGAMRLSLECASAALLLTDDRSGMEVPILEAALLNLACEATLRSLLPQPLLALPGAARSVVCQAGLLRTLEATAASTLLLDYHNAEKGAWEPLVEPWALSCRVSAAPSAPQGGAPARCHLALTSPARLELTLTEACSEALAHAVDTVRDATAPEEGHCGDDGASSVTSTPAAAAASAATAAAYSPYWLHNQAGVPLRYLLSTQEAGACGSSSCSSHLAVAWQAGLATGAAGTLQPGALAPLLAGAACAAGSGGRYVRPVAQSSPPTGGAADAPAADAQRSTQQPPAQQQQQQQQHVAGGVSSRQFRCVRVSLEGSEWFSRGLSLDALGSRTFDARVAGLKARAVCEVQRRQLPGRGRALVLRSDVALRNLTHTPLEVAVHRHGGSTAALGDAPQPMALLAPGQRTWLPLLSTEGSAPVLRVRPAPPPPPPPPSLGELDAGAPPACYVWSEPTPMRPLIDGAGLAFGRRPHATAVCARSHASPRGAPFWLCIDAAPAPRTSSASSSGASAASAAAFAPAGAELRLRPPLEVHNALPVTAELCVRGPGATGGSDADARLPPGATVAMHALDPSAYARLFFCPQGFARSSPVALPTAAEMAHQASAFGAASPQSQDEDECEDADGMGGPLPPHLVEVMPTSFPSGGGGGVTLAVFAGAAGGGAARRATLRARLVLYNHTRLALLAEQVDGGGVWGGGVGGGESPWETGWRRSRGRLLPPCPTSGDAPAASALASLLCDGGARQPPPAGAEGVAACSGDAALHAGLRCFTAAGLRALSARPGALGDAASPSTSVADLLALPGEGGGGKDLTSAALHASHHAPPMHPLAGDGAAAVMHGGEAEWMSGDGGGGRCGCRRRRPQEAAQPPQPGPNPSPPTAATRATAPPWRAPNRCWLPGLTAAVEGTRWS